MPNGLVKVGDVGLPQLPVRMPPLEGENLEPSALMLHPGYKSAEGAIVDFRLNHAPESLKWYRRYYLKPHQLAGRPTGKQSLRYMWNLRNPATDRTVGMIEGDDLAAAQILIGNGVAGAYMSPIRWELCEDRDGEEPIAIGRFDPWSLLQNVSSSDIERLAPRGILPNSKKWDFDLMYIGRVCPACGTMVTINMFAFSIDSAKCAKCGTRPFLSRALGSMLHFYLPTVTGESEQGLETDLALLHAIQWMGGVNAAAAELHKEELPDQFTPHLVLKGLLKKSQLLAATEGGGLTLAPRLVEHFESSSNGRSMMEVAVGAANSLAGAIEAGGPFTKVHCAMVEMLRAMDKEVK
ncbi:hypothetical protein HZB94_04150 [Candidatus Falkowbacteria bacterium]|nr:hypothetical protein [Candidatus Falkowbacteria bacterium]